MQEQIELDFDPDNPNIDKYLLDSMNLIITSTNSDTDILPS